jgi:hypothetical protein
MTDYTTYDIWKSETTTTDSDETAKATVERLITGASRGIDHYCNCPDDFFVAIDTATTRYYVGSGKTYQLIDECVVVAAVAVKDSASDDEDAYDAWTVGVVGTTTDADCFPASGDPAYPDYNSTPYNLLILGSNTTESNFTSGTYSHRGGFRPTTLITRGVPTVEVSARWGYATTVPPDIRTACTMIVEREYKRLAGGMSDALASGELGQIIYVGQDPDVERILKHGRYIKPATGRR